jgi:NifB/MoaA-like Fe-S oxidoreductase
LAKGGIISAIHQGSLAEELELVPGDKIISINEQELTDIIDLSFALADEEIEMLIEHENGEQEIIAFEKDIDEELGAEFESAVFGKIRQCANNCYFCFVDQVAPNMRDSLYIKDDDYRLSFLYGNFVTMTNMGPRDLERIHRLHHCIFLCIQLIQNFVGKCLEQNVVN